MSRFRSSFDFGGALLHAASLKPDDGKALRPYRGLSLVSFAHEATSLLEAGPGDGVSFIMAVPMGGAEPPHGEADATEPRDRVGRQSEAQAASLPESTGWTSPPQAAPSDPRQRQDDPMEGAVTNPAPPRLSLPAPAEARALEEMERALEIARKPPRLPDLTQIASPSVRCEKIVEWIIDATGASNVFIADGGGLPIGGAVADAETLIANCGVVTSAVTQLAAAVPGNTSTIFEMHLGEGPFFQLIGFHIGALLYLVGLTRASPLNPRQAHAVRLACRHALAETAVATV